MTFESGNKPLRIAFLHPDLGIGGAERLVVDAALGLQNLGHTVHIYTSHHDPSHCFDETRNGTLSVHYVKPPFPRSLSGKLHIIFAHLRQLHLVSHILWSQEHAYDIYLVDQLSTCVPLLRMISHTRVVFYCHFPDKLLAHGSFFEAELGSEGTSLLKRIYRFPMDWLEEFTTSQADIILVNSKFTLDIVKRHFASIKQIPRVAYPGINITAYETPVDESDPSLACILSPQPTLLSLNRFENKKNLGLAIHTFAALRSKHHQANIRLVVAGGYDSRVEDNVQTLSSLIEIANSLNLTYVVLSSRVASLTANIIRTNTTSGQPPHILFILSFTTAQRSALLQSPSTLALLYTPINEHFGIGPVEAMACGVPVLACNSGGPTESVVQFPEEGRTGWLCQPEPEIWAEVLANLMSLPPGARGTLSTCGKRRARELFGMEAMSRSIEKALSDAVHMGPVESGFTTYVMILVGFAIAYITGPLIL